VLARGIAWKSHHRPDRLPVEAPFRGCGNVENRTSSRKSRHCVFNIN
jgi:hypothetical protein